MTNDSTILAALKSGLYKFFGKTEADTTSAELDNLLQGAGTLSEIQESARNEALLSIQSKMDDFETRLTAYETTLSERDQTISSLTTEKETLEAQNATLTADSTANATLLAANKAKITQLAGEVSALKAGKPTTQDDGGGDTNFEIVETKGNTVEVKATAVNDRLGFN